MLPNWKFTKTVPIGHRNEKLSRKKFIDLVKEIISDDDLSEKEVTKLRERHGRIWKPREG